MRTKFHMTLVKADRIIKSGEIFRRIILISEEGDNPCQGVASMSLLIRDVKLIDEISSLVPDV